MGELSEQEIKKMINLVKDFRNYTKVLAKKMPAKVSPNLLKSLKLLEFALQTGKDIGDAMEDTRKQIKLVDEAVSTACGLVLKVGKGQRVKNSNLDMDTVCQAKAFRNWQLRAVKFTVDPSIPDSVFNKLGKKHMAKLKKYLSDFDVWSKKVKKTLQ